MGTTKRGTRDERDGKEHRWAHESDCSVLLVLSSASHSACAPRSLSLLSGTLRATVKAGVSASYRRRGASQRSQQPQGSHKKQREPIRTLRALEAGKRIKDFETGGQPARRQARETQKGKQIETQKGKQSEETFPDLSDSSTRLFLSRCDSFMLP